MMSLGVVRVLLRVFLAFTTNHLQIDATFLQATGKFMSTIEQLNLEYYLIQAQSFFITVVLIYDYRIFDIVHFNILKCDIFCMPGASLHMNNT
jgi:hypothetical protein